MIKHIQATRLCAYGVIAIAWPIAAISFAVLWLWNQMWYLFLDSLDLFFGPGGGGGGGKPLPEGVPMKVGTFIFSP